VVGCPISPDSPDLASWGILRVHFYLPSGFPIGPLRDLWAVDLVWLFVVGCSSSSGGVGVAGWGCFHLGLDRVRFHLHGNPPL
jgi:hypothetical protein